MTCKSKKAKQYKSLQREKEKARKKAGKK